MRISEIFYSIQGEGALTGVPSVFVRTSGCNLRCRWCDTPYASWNPEGQVFSPEDLFKKITAFAGAAHVVLTGGEPMLAPGVSALTQKLKNAGWHITIETAGTIAPGDVTCDLASLSPKLSDSTPSEEECGVGWVARHEATRLQPQIIKEWILRGEYQLKFVVAKRHDLTEISDLLSELKLNVPAHKILLMPEGTDSETLRTRGLEVAEWCKEKGYRLCDRLHVHLYGHTRGT